MRAGPVIAVLAILILVASPVAILSPALAQTTQTPKLGGTFITAVAADPANLNPILAAQGSTSAGTDSNAAFDSLLQTDTNYKLMPDLAQSWTISPNGTVYTFNLVHNATWSDGVPFTSADVQYSMAANIQYAPLGKTMFSVIKSITTPDQYTAVFHLANPWPSMLLFLAGTFTAPMIPAHVYNGTNFLTNPANNAPVGTGPFTFKEWVKGDHITYVKNPHYWKKGLPYLDQIIIKIIPNPSTMAAALQSGDIGSMWQFSSAPIYQQLEGKSGITVLPDTPSTEADQGVSLLYFNLNNTILKNQQVRYAIAHAINQSQIFQLDYLGVGAVAKGPVSYKSIEFYNKSIAPTYAYNLTLANQLLDKAGYPRASNGTRFTLVLVDAAGSAQLPDDQIVKANLAQVGINVFLNTETVAASITDIYVNRHFDLADHIIFAGPDASIAEYVTWGCQFIGAGTNTNAEGYCNPAADKLITDAQTQTNETKRVQDMNQWQSIVMTDLPVFPLIDTVQWEAFRTEWVGIPTNPFGPVTMFSERIWWQGGTPQAVTTTTTSISTTTIATTTTAISVATSTTTATSIATTTATSIATTTATTTVTTSNDTVTIGAAVVVVLIVIIAGVYLARRGRPSAGGKPAS